MVDKNLVIVHPELASKGLQDKIVEYAKSLGSYNPIYILEGRIHDQPQSPMVSELTSLTNTNILSSYNYNSPRGHAWIPVDGKEYGGPRFDPQFLTLKRMMTLSNPGFAELTGTSKDVGIPRLYRLLTADKDFLEKNKTTFQEAARYLGISKEFEQIYSRPIQTKIISRLIQ